MDIEMEDYCLLLNLHSDSLLGLVGAKSRVVYVSSIVYARCNICRTLELAAVLRRSRFDEHSRI